MNLVRTVNPASTTQLACHCGDTGEKFHFECASPKSVFENSVLVVRATALCRPATRRTDGSDSSSQWAWPFRNVAGGTSVRRVGNRGGRAARATILKTGS